MPKRIRCGICGMPNMVNNEKCWNCHNELMVKCAECGHLNLTEAQNCLKCNTEIQGFDLDYQAVQESVEIEQVEKRYPALQTIAVVFKGMAILMGFVTVVAILIGLGEGILPFALMPLIFGPILVLILLAVSEGIRVFIDIEENTRTTARLLGEWTGFKNQSS